MLTCHCTRLSVQGNQIHFQILAAIPSVIIVTYGTKLFIRFLYNIRSKDLRPVNAAHAEMTIYLNQLESLVLRLSSPSSSMEKTREMETQTTLNDTDPALMGEALLCIHRYKILLDFSSWSIPSRTIEDIDISLRQLLMALGNRTGASLNRGTDRVGASKQASVLSTNMQWVRLVKEKHAKLNQYF